MGSRLPALIAAITGLIVAVVGLYREDLCLVAFGVAASLSLVLSDRYGGDAQ